MLTEVISGAVLAIVTVAVPVPVSPSGSVAVAVQRMASPGEDVLLLSVTEAPDPRLVPALVLVQA
jgi:hypothetical protein